MIISQPEKEQELKVCSVTWSDSTVSNNEIYF